MAEKDNFEMQSNRILQAAKKLCSTCAVEFDDNNSLNWIRFRITDGGTTLTSAYPEFHVSEVADWTDQRLQQVIESVTGGRVRAGD